MSPTVRKAGILGPGNGRKGTSPLPDSLLAALLLLASSYRAGDTAGQWVSICDVPCAVL